MRMSPVWPWWPVAWIRHKGTGQVASCLQSIPMIKAHVDSLELGEGMTCGHSVLWLLHVACITGPWGSSVEITDTSIDFSITLFCNANGAFYGNWASMPNLESTLNLCYYEQMRKGIVHNFVWPNISVVRSCKCHANCILWGCFCSYSTIWGTNQACQFKYNCRLFEVKEERPFLCTGP